MLLSGDLSRTFLLSWQSKSFTFHGTQVRNRFIIRVPYLSMMARERRLAEVSQHMWLSRIEHALYTAEFFLRKIMSKNFLLHQSTGNGLVWGKSGFRIEIREIFSRWFLTYSELIFHHWLGMRLLIWVVCYLCVSCKCTKWKFMCWTCLQNQLQL